MSQEFWDQGVNSIWGEDPTDETGSEYLLLDAIANGQLDEHLVAIADAIQGRRELLHTVASATALAQFCIGETVRINRSIRPRYLSEEFGTITELDDHGITIRLSRPVGRFTSGQIRCPPLALEKVPRATSRQAA